MKAIGNTVRRLLWSGQLGEKTCSHLSLIQEVTPSAAGCEECLAIGDTWVHLRLCLICGHVGCCDNSKNKHATAHFHETTHPVVRSREPGETWVWCYLDAQMMKGGDRS